jgi:aminoglycoside/choline kinase family phosphotransferase
MCSGGRGRRVCPTGVLDYPARMRDAIVALYSQTLGHPPELVVRLRADGSQRHYYRLGGNGRATVVGAYGPEAEENRAFLAFSRALRKAGLPVPEIYAADESLGIWLEEDLGDTTLFAALTAARATGDGAFPSPVLTSYERVVDTLPRFQVDGARAVDFALAYPRAAFDAQSMLWDLNYFKYHFLKLAHVPFNEQRLENDFVRLVDHLLAADTDYFLYRDFQSRNIMLRAGQPWFVDYQGGRRGAAQYDIASLLYDAKADLPEDVRAHLLERYLDAFARHTGGDRSRFMEHYPGYVLIRIMQAMGAYGYRGFFERKPRFLESVPYAARNVARLLEAGLPVALPELEGVFRSIVDAWATHEGPMASPRGLHVRVSSFSYRDGLPGDESGHGGGFVFDCRSLSNPGRRPELSVHVGTDPEIVRYLEAMPETEVFWKHVTSLVDAHIANFRERNFTDFSVAFGCTGGQHRSVYFAERLARHVRERHPGVAISLRHLAESKWKLEGGAAPDAPAAAEGSDGVAGHPEGVSPPASAADRRR